MPLFFTRRIETSFIEFYDHLVSGNTIGRTLEYLFKVILIDTRTKDIFVFLMLNPCGDPII